MSAPELIPFRAEHMMMFVDRAQSREQLWIAVQKERRGPAYTAVVNGIILGCAGVVIVWPGVGAAWSVYSEDIGKYGIWMTRTTRRILEDICRIYKLHRLETMVIGVDNKRNKRWVELLGFTPENGVATAYTSDRKDATRYERILWDQPCQSSQ